MTVAAVLTIRHNGRDITGADQDRPENIPIRAWRQIMKHGFKEAGLYWHKNYLPLHFTRAAFFRYPEAYKPRTNSYYARHHLPEKVKKADRPAAIAAARAKHEPLVFRGTLREMSRHATARAFQTRVTIRIPTPKYVRQRPMAGQPDIPAELGAVNSQEVETLTAVVQRTIDADMRAFVTNRSLPDLS